MQWPSGLFVFLALWALIWWLLEIVAEWVREPDADEDDEFMEDPAWLEIHDAAEAYLRSGDTVTRHRLERALEEVTC